jgi:acetyl-CoA hydrolase
VCADSIGHRLYSGVGGQLDFIYGASRSKGGVPIIALPSTAKDFSRIVATLKPGAGVVTTRNHVHYIVTEYGIADLYGKTIRQRAQQLIHIAHPMFRDELTRQAKELHYL